MQGKKWTVREEEQLVKLFPEVAVTDLCRILEKSRAAIQCKAHRLYLVSNSAKLERANEQRALHGGRPRVRKVDESYFAAIDTAEKAYWLGFLWADGTVAVKSGAYWAVKLNLSHHDEEHVQRFAEALQTDYPVQQYSSNGRHYVRLTVNSKKLVQHLLVKGIVPRKTYQQIIPTVPLEFSHHFIRGVFDGDGSISQVRGRAKQRSYCQSQVQIAGTYATVQWIQQTVQKQIGILGGFCRQPPSMVTWKYYLGSREQIGRFASWLYQDATIFLARKRERFIEYALL